jgi:hypothetical protein
VRSPEQRLIEASASAAGGRGAMIGRSLLRALRSL